MGRIKTKKVKRSTKKIFSQIQDTLTTDFEENKKVNEITKNERKKLINLLREFELNVKGLVGFEKAIITSGGVDLKEVDPKTMKSKIIDNLYFAGEILDIDGPTGGYNLQIAWSTGYLIGENNLL